MLASNETDLKRAHPNFIRRIHHSELIILPNEHQSQHSISISWRAYGLFRWSNRAMNTPSQYQINYGNAMSRNLMRWVNVGTYIVRRRGSMLSPVQQKCQREFSRFTTKEPPTKRLKEPDRGILDLLRKEEFSIWLEMRMMNSTIRQGLITWTRYCTCMLDFHPISCWS